MISFSPAIISEFHHLDVNAVYLFGSYAEGRQTPLSDIDIAILLHHGSQVAEDKSITILYQRLYELLEPTLSSYAKEFDLVFLQRASLELQANVIRFGNILYEDDKEKRLDYEEYVMRLYADFAPLRQQIDQAVLAKI